MCVEGLMASANAMHSTFSEFLEPGAPSSDFHTAGQVLCSCGRTHPVSGNEGCLVCQQDREYAASLQLHLDRSAHVDSDGMELTSYTALHTLTVDEVC
jgi:hypothetical protein